MNRYSLTVAALALALAGRAVPPAWAQTTLTLQDAQQLAARNFETVRLAKEEVEQARLLRRQALSAILPNVNLNGTYTRNLVSAEFEFGGEVVRVLPANDYSLGVTFSQPLFAGFRELRALRQAEANIDAAGVALGTNVRNTVLDVTRGYYRVLGAEENVEISRRGLEVAQATLKTAESLYRAGEAVETAVLRGRVAVTGAERGLLDARNQLTLVREQLRIFLGVDSGFRVTRPAPPAPPVGSIETLIDEGLRSRSELQAL